MLYPRIIPCLLVKNKGLVKTVNFLNPKYVGDPINAVKIFNEKEVDELIVLDIDASTENREPDFKMIENLAAECRMPLCYGGGIKSVECAQRIFELGVEKIAISSAALEDPQIVLEISKRVGSQSVVVVLDIKKNETSGKYEIWKSNGRINAGESPAEFARQMQALGAGEIIINCIDNDGMMKGYDFQLVEEVRSAVFLPLTVLGGAGSFDDIKQLINKYGIIGAGAGSLFVFKGKFRAVLINYPTKVEKERLVKASIVDA